ncbi:MAG TPA: penicillin-binding transpeptidase domain-containing protein, partial [Streptomyces sp.]|nr:penicillin-binding transpeptidase domain-containing protein [Streptomyces sp.]
PLEMAGVYATLANHGKKVTPAMVKSAEHRTGTYTMPDAIGEQVIGREAADTVTSVLTGVVDDGTAKTSVRDNPLRRGQQVAGKTGTSDNNKSAWFTGYTPDLVTSVGLFGEDAKTQAQTKMYGAGGMPRVNGGGFPAQIWSAYTFGVLDEVSEFDLRTRQGAGVEPTESPTASEEPSEGPSESPTEQPSETPSGTPTTDQPTGGPSDGPTGPPTATPPTDEPTGEITLDPVDPGDGERDQR